MQKLLPSQINPRHRKGQYSQNEYRLYRLSPGVISNKPHKRKQKRRDSQQACDQYCPDAVRSVVSAEAPEGLSLPTKYRRRRGKPRHHNWLSPQEASTHQLIGKLSVDGSAKKESHTAAMSHATVNHVLVMPSPHKSWCHMAGEKVSV